jgi:hypothetical protein
MGAAMPDLAASPPAPRPPRRRPLAAAALALAASACTPATSEVAREDRETCERFAGPVGSPDYAACLARLDAQHRDDLLLARTRYIVDHH